MKHKKMSPMAQKIGQAFTNPIQKNQLFVSNGSGVISLFNKILQPRFFAKKMTGQKR
jgi:hypothetical protein